MTKSKKAGPVAWGVLAVTVVLFVLVVFGGDERKDDPHASARGACRHFVTQQAKDPGSVSFDSTDTWVVTHSGDTWTVILGMRAKNSFGALVHGTYVCQARLTGGQWTLASISTIAN